MPSTTPLLRILVSLVALGLGQSAMALETVPALASDSPALCPSAAKVCPVAPAKAPLAIVWSPDCQENCQTDTQLDTVGWALPALSRWPNYSRNAYRLRDSGHNHQGVNSLAHRKSLLKQTGELDSQSSSEDFSFETGTSSPWLRANLRDRPLNPPHLDRAGWALPTLDSKLAQPSPQIPQAIAPPSAATPPESLALDPEAMVEDPPQGANAPTLDLDPAVIEGSPTLQRWLDRIPDITDEIRHQPSFRTRLRAGYAQFPSTDQIGGFGAAVEDVFLVPGTGLSASADYSRSWNGNRQSYGGEARYYLLPLGGYVNIAPTVGYRSLHTPAYQTDGLDLGLRLMLVPSRGGGADLALSQRWVAPGGEGEVGITSLAIGYAVTRQLRLGTDFQLQNSRFGQDSRFGLSLELLL